MGFPSVSPGPFSQNTAHGLAGQGSQGWPGCCPSKGAAGWKSPSRWGGAESRAASCAARARRAAGPAMAAPSGMAVGCQGEGEHGPTLAGPRGVLKPPVSPSLNGDSLSSWHSEPQCWHRHLLLLLLPGRESRAAGRAPVSCGPAPRAGAGGAGGLCSAAKGPRTGSVRKANPCQRAWLVDTCMAPCARCATRLSPRPRVLWKSPGLGAVPLLIHFEASQP